MRLEKVESFGVGGVVPGLSTPLRDSNKSSNNPFVWGPADFYTLGQCTFDLEWVRGALFL